LRAPEAGDAKYAAAWHDSPYPITRQRAEKIINEELPKAGDQGAAHLIACRRTDDVPVGGVVYRGRDDRTNLVRVTANPALSDRAAIKAEILRIIVPWLSTEVRRMVVWAELNAPEPELRAAADAIGMRPTARFREAIWRDGARHDQWVYELLHPRWVERLGDPGSGIRQATEPPAPSGGPRFAKESLDLLVAQFAATRNLKRHQAAEARIERLPNHTEPALADFLQ
jgi:RimJ/RimL family protein N-acetyltransferase